MREKQKNLPTAQETSLMSLGPYFCFPHLPHVPSALASPSLIHHYPRSVVHRRQLLAPMIHRASSGSQGWGQVLGCSCHWAYWLTAAVEGVGCPSLLLPLPVIIAPHSTPRAVAHSGSCCLIPAVCCPVIHPASSGCRWGLKWVAWVCRLGVVSL
jgi:hypothetical protein